MSCRTRLLKDSHRRELVNSNITAMYYPRKVEFPSYDWKPLYDTQANHICTMYKTIVTLELNCNIFKVDFNGLRLLY